MVILGFRPKTDTKENKGKSEGNNANVNNSNIATMIESKKTFVKPQAQVKPNVQAKPPHVQSQSKFKPQSTVSVSSNWKRLKSLKVLTAAEMKTSGESVKKVSDSEWFGVKDVEEFAAGRDDQILRENVSTASLFPPPPPGMSEEKLKQPCKFIALDCEMVGTGLRGFESILARVSVVNFHGIELMDVYVRPTRKVVDYRTAVSGVTAGHLTSSKEDPSVNIFGQPLLTLTELQNRLIPLLHDRIVVGHALNNDFSALLLSSNHPRRLIRDTSRYRPFRALANGRSPSLKMLAAKILGVRIQSASHDSVDDARIAMLLYRSVKSQWENAIFTGSDKKKKSEKTKKRRRSSNSDDDDDNENENDKEDNIFNSIL